VKPAKPADLPVEQPTIRHGDKPQGRQADRHDDSAECFSQSRQSNPMTNPNAVYELAKQLQPLLTNGAQRLNGALAVERFELTKMIPPNVLARADRVIK
jgi:hypothetical protein